VWRWGSLANHASTLLAFVPVLVGARGLARRATGAKWLWAFLLLSALQNVAMYLTMRSGNANQWLSQLLYPVQCILVLTALGLLAGHPTVRRVFRWGIGGFLAWWAFWAVGGELRADFGVYNSPALTLVICAAAATTILIRLRAMPERPLRDIGVLSGIALLVMYAAGAALAPVADVLFESHGDLTLLFFGVRAILDTIGSIIFALALLWTTPQLGSSGSSASAP
jgi:hypothetical protein